MTTALEEQRDYLLRSIADLDAEYAAGDIDESDYRSLRDDYTARAAAVLRELEGVAATPGPSTPPTATATTTAVSRSWRRVAVPAAVVIVALAVGWFVARSAGERVDGAPSSGSVPEASTDRIASAQRLVREGDILGAVKMYDALLDDDPENPVALAEKGWLLSRVDVSLVDDGLASIDAALALDPEYPEAHFYRGMILLEAKRDPAAAAAEFDAALAGNPPPDLRAFLEEMKRKAAEQVPGTPTPSP